MKVNLYGAEKARWAITLQGNFSEFSDPGMAGSKFILQMLCNVFDTKFSERHVLLSFVAIIRM